MVTALVLSVAGSAPLIVVNLDDNVAPVPALTILDFASFFAMEFAAVLLVLALSQRAHIQALKRSCRRTFF